MNKKVKIGLIIAVVLVIIIIAITVIMSHNKENVENRARDNITSEGDPGASLEEGEIVRLPNNEKMEVVPNR